MHGPCISVFSTRYGDIVLHRNLKTDPTLFLKLIAPYREDRVVAVEGIFGLADRCVQEGAYPL